MATAKDDDKEARERWEKRQAVQIIGQLPEDPEAAMRVLEFARELLTDFLGPRPQQRVHSVKVVPLRSDEDGGQTNRGS